MSGAEYFVYQTGDQVKSSPVVDHMTGSVYIGSHDHHLHGLNVEQVIFQHYRIRTCFYSISIASRLGSSDIHRSEATVPQEIRADISSMVNPTLISLPKSGSLLSILLILLEGLASPAFFEWLHLLLCIHSN